jgi:hypothetical protein
LYPFLGGFGSREPNPPFVALRFRYQHNPSGIPAPIGAQRQKSAGNYLGSSSVRQSFYDSLNKLPKAICLLFAIK